LVIRRSHNAGRNPSSAAPRIKGRNNKAERTFVNGNPTVHKDLSLISLVPKWRGPESAVLLEEFFESIESAAKIGRWHTSDCLQIAALKLTDSARIFYNTCLELHAEEATWDKFKKALRERFRDVRTNQYHFM
jgi:hypothetical protein